MVKTARRTEVQAHMLIACSYTYICNVYFGMYRYPEMYILDGAPTKKSGHNTVLTTGRDEVELIRDSHKILKELATQPEWQNTHVAYVSRTTETSWAKKCLKLLESQDGLTLDQQGRLQVCTTAHSHYSPQPFAAVLCLALLLQEPVSCVIFAAMLGSCWQRFWLRVMTHLSDTWSTLQEIYPGNKRTHFTRLHEQTSIPFSQMVR